MFSSKASVALLVPLLCVISAFPAMWWHINASGSRVLRNIAWPAWSLGSEAGCDRAFWFYILFSSNQNAPFLDQCVFFFSTCVYLFQHLWSPLFSCKHTKAGEDGDVKLCLTNILLRRHLILISRPQAPGATWVRFKADSHIGIFSTLFSLACRANSLGISVYIWVWVCVYRVSGEGGWAVYMWIQNCHFIRALSSYQQYDHASKWLLCLTA